PRFRWSGGGRGRQYGRPRHRGHVPSPPFVPLPPQGVAGPGLMRLNPGKPLLLQCLQELFPFLFQFRSVSVVTYGAKSGGILVDDPSSDPAQVFPLLFREGNTRFHFVDAVEWAAEQPVPVAVLS